MKVGRLRHRLRLERRIDVEGDDGEIEPGYRLIAEVWGSIEPMSGREFFAAQQVNAEASVRIVIRWREGVEATSRVVNGSDLYDVVAPLADPVINRRWLTLLCKRRESEGWRSGQ